MSNFLTLLWYFQPGAIYVSQSLHFRLPVYIGEEIVGEVEATNIREQKNRCL